MRAVAEIRRYLLLKRLYDRVVQLGKQSSKMLTDHDLQLLHVETRQVDVYVQYRHQGLIHEAMFTLAMLDAEIEGWLSRSPFVPEDQHG